MDIWIEYQQPIMVALPVVVLGLLYLLRSNAHQLLERVAKALHRSLRLMARGCQRAEQRIRLRNHEVTKALAEALMERQLERRFMRIERLVERDLDNYKKLAAQINQQLKSISEDYDTSAEVPAPAPEWIAAVEAIGNLEADSRNSEVMARILADMHDTVKQHQRETLREHRWTVAARHKVLASLRPQWRKLTKLLEHIDFNLEILRQRLRQVDKHMGQFELLTSGSGQGIMASMLMRFVVALSFVALGTLAAAVNLQLLQEPLSQILVVGQISNVSLSELLAFLHVGMTLVAAALITESLRITHLLPLTGAMTRRGRLLMGWLGAGLLIVTVGVEVTALLSAATAQSELVVNGLSTATLAFMAIALPLVVAVSIIPLEYLLHTVRPVVGVFIQVSMHIAAMGTRLLAALAIDAGRASQIIYDVVIFLPLMLERAVERRKASVQVEAKTVAEPHSRQTVGVEVGAENVTEFRFRGSSSRHD